MEINRDVVKWALDWNRLSVEELASRAEFKSLPKWLSGEKEPTFKQLEKFAARTHTLVPYFYMDSLPQVALQIPDFRTTSGASPRRPSPELFETIDDMLFRQSWMSDFFKSVDYDPIDFIGRYKAADLNVAHVASYLHELLKLDVDWARAGTFEETVRRMRHAIERCRVSVSISGYCRNATRRGFDVHEFRGFVLCDDYAPMIFVNGKDAKVAQIFTMVHEMVHLLLAQTGLVGGEEPEALGAEEFCDRVAAEFLLPADEFVFAWERGGKDRKRVIEGVQKRFKVSFATAARRALELNLVSEGEYSRLCRDHYEGLDEFARPHSDGGGNSYNNIGSKLGTVFMEAIYIAVKSNALSYSDAYKLAGLKAKTFNELYKRKELAL